MITDYSVQYRRRGTSSYSTCSVAGSSTTSYIVNLNRGTVYEVRVASVGPLGLSGYCCGSGKQVTTYSVGVQQCSYSRNCLYTFCEHSTINDPYDWCRDNLHLYIYSTFEQTAYQNISEQYQRNTAVQLYTSILLCDNIYIIAKDLYMC